MSKRCLLRCRPDGTYEQMRLRDLMPSPLTGRSMESADSNRAKEGLELAAR